MAMRRRRRMYLQRHDRAEGQGGAIPPWSELIGLTDEPLHALALEHGVETAGRNRFAIAGELNRMRSHGE